MTQLWLEWYRLLLLLVKLIVLQSMLELGQIVG